MHLGPAPLTPPVQLSTFGITTRDSIPQSAGIPLTPMIRAPAGSPSTQRRTCASSPSSAGGSLWSTPPARQLAPAVLFLVRRDIITHTRRHSVMCGQAAFAKVAVMETGLCELGGRHSLHQRLRAWSHPRSAVAGPISTIYVHNVVDYPLLCRLSACMFSRRSRNTYTCVFVRPSFTPCADPLDLFDILRNKFPTVGNSKFSDRW